MRVQIPGPRDDRGDAGANIVTLDDCRVADFDAVDVGDRVERAGREYADGQAHVSCPRALLLRL